MKGDVALFSHGHFLRALAVRWCDLSIRYGPHLFLDTGSLSILSYESRNVSAPAVFLWNAVSNEVLITADSRTNP
jgi:probable phosphoglycerate mutase